MKQLEFDFRTADEKLAEATRIMAEELAKEIDQEILDSLLIKAGMKPMKKSELELQRLKYVKETGLCPDCVTELNYKGYHERDSTYDDVVCPKCGWRVRVSTLDEIEVETCTNTIKIYLCGPIMGCSDAECKDWRSEVKKRFSDTIDPMRRDYRGRESECVKEIVELDKKDIDEADALLVNHPKPSVGTSMEVLYAWEKGKFIVVVCPKGTPRSPWLIYHSTAIVETFEEAYELLEEERRYRV